MSRFSFGMVNRAEEGCRANYLPGGRTTLATGTHSFRDLDESPCPEIRPFTINGELTRARLTKSNLGHAVTNGGCTWT